VAREAVRYATRVLKMKHGLIQLAQDRNRFGEVLVMKNIPPICKRRLIGRKDYWSPMNVTFIHNME